MKSRRQLKAISLKLRGLLKPKKLLTIGISFAIGIVALIVFVNLWVAHQYSDRKYSNIEDIEPKKVAIVFGAGLWGDGGPSPILEDRILTAIDLYEEGKVQKIIMSGDNRFENYDEPTVMINFALEKGVPEAVLQPDYAGRRTYDTCYRAKEVFRVNEAILVTQKFHLDRAMYICDSLGIDVVGVEADRRDYENSWFALRDDFALIKSVWELNVAPPDNVVLGDTIEL